LTVSRHKTIKERETARSDPTLRGAASPPVLLCLDGEPGEVLAEGSPGGRASASLSLTLIRRGARMTSDPADIRLSMNLTGTERGSCEWISAGRRITHAGEPDGIYLSPPGLDFEASPSADGQILMIRLPSDLMSLALGDLGVAVGSIIERICMPDRLLSNMAMALRRELALGLPNGPLYWAEISDGLALNIVERHVLEPVAIRASVLPKSSIRKLNDLVGDCMGEQITLDDLAGAAGYSRFRFLRAFTKTLGMTPSRYVMHRRARAAIFMARCSRDSLASIASATGFADQSHLCRWCKQVYGIRLSEIRPPIPPRIFSC
jgi:AraC family transcriptional regulator